MKEINKKWEPWVTYEKEQEVLPITQPPCSVCKYWHPTREYTNAVYTGVRLCQSQMFNDFSCFINLADEEDNE